MRKSLNMLVKGCKQKLFAFVLLLFIFLNACKKDKSATIDFGYNYYPLTTGSWIIYDCDSITYELDVITKKFQIKELVDSSFIDDEGDLGFKVLRYRREAANQVWAIQDIWVSYLDSRSADKIEENKRIVKIIFPLKQEKKWNGNAKNIGGIEEFVLDSLDYPSIINNLSFDSILTVTHLFDQNIIQKLHVYEQYAKNVGMISFHRDSLEIQSVDGQADTSGVTFDMRINSFFINK